MRVKLTLEYDGSQFHGWQLQPNLPTLQGTLEGALATILREPVRVLAAGRTDAGVHARGQVAAFDTTRTIDSKALQRSLNVLAGPAIAVLAVEMVPDEFDPRRDACARVYAYTILNRVAPSPLLQRQAWHVPWPLDGEAMRAAAALLEGEHDFSAFRDADCDAVHAVRRVHRSAVSRDGDLLIFEIEATAFLRHMVRIIVGTLVRVGSGALTVDDYRDIFVGRDRTRAGETAPAQGLCLVAVRYP
jgi:tRNA pseudouridine38-40 synthase